MDQRLEQRIRRRAYDLWLADDKPEGSHLRFWKEAEAEIIVEDEKVEQSPAARDQE